MNKILIVYFSGTFGTELVVKNIEKSLSDKGCSVDAFPLDLSKVKSLSDANDKISEVDRLIIAYPVYSYDAPIPVHKWIDVLPEAKGTKASVLSISAGGEAFTNRTSRQHCIKHLEEKGFAVDYEKMITMPSNYAKTADDNINALLVKAVPVIAETIADDVINNVVLRERKKIAVAPVIASHAFKPFACDFGATLLTNENCIDCKWCQDNCPTNNITITDGKIETKDQCTLCLRCVYGCPVNALYSKKYSFSMIKEGFNIKAFEKKAVEIDTDEIENLKWSHAWDGAIKYLKEVFSE